MFPLSNGELLARRALESSRVPGRVVSIGVEAASMALWLSCSSGQTSVVGPTNSKCQIQVSNSPSSFPATGGTGTVTVSTTGDCTWTVTSDAAWVSISGNSSGQGAATVAYTVGANPAPSPRSGGIGVSPNFMRLSQAAAPQRALNGEVSRLLGVCPLLTFVVSGKTVITGQSTVFRGEPCSALHGGQNVTVRGVTQADGTVLANSVDLASGQ